MTLADIPQPEPKEGTLVIVGFLGRGNAGDEAMLQVLFETFYPRFDIVVGLTPLALAMRSVRRRVGHHPPDPPLPE